MKLDGRAEGPLDPMVCLGNEAREAHRLIAAGAVVRRGDVGAVQLSDGRWVRVLFDLSPDERRIAYVPVIENFCGSLEAVLSREGN